MSILPVNLETILTFVADNPPGNWAQILLGIACTVLASICVFFLKRMADAHDKFPEMIREEREARQVGEKEERQAREAGLKAERDARQEVDGQMLEAIGKVSGRIQVLEALEERRAG